MVKIGLEIHGYLDTNEKLFCRCRVSHGKKFSEPNTNICPVCTGQPGSKPLLPNFEAIKKVVLISLILGCKINKKLVWQRKHYSWPDLPKGFQSTISGPHSIPNGVGGNFMGIGIRECHIEEDPAAWNPATGEIDYNRSGSPLIEIVTEPDFKSAEEVADWLGNLMSALSYVKAIDKKAGLKVDVNVSIPKGKRVEMKNINSVRKIKDAIEIEVARQEKDLPKVEETRTYVEEKKTTLLMRTKDSAMDYRFISDPDLPSFEIFSSEVEKIKKSIPELPQEKLKKLIKVYKIDKKNAEVLSKKLSLVELFEEVINNKSKKIRPEVAISWITVELIGVANYNKIDIDEIEINPEHFAELLEAIQDGKINELKAKEILRGWKNGSFSPTDEISSGETIRGDEIEKIALEVVKENKKAVEDYKNGEKNSLNFLIGQVMRKTEKRADFNKAREEIIEILRK